MIEALQHKIDDSQLPYEQCGDDTDIHFFAFSHRRLMRLKKPRVLLLQFYGGAFLSATWFPNRRHFRSDSSLQVYELDSVWRVFELIDPFSLQQGLDKQQAIS